MNKYEIKPRDYDDLGGFSLFTTARSDMHASHHTPKKQSTVLPGKDVTMKEINIGISEKDRQKIADGLSRLLADSYTLYLQTHNFHWNVSGPMFRTLHLMFEAQYQELALAVDQIAERIRALGFPAPATYAEFIELSSIQEEPGVPSAERMIAILCEGQEAVVQTARDLAPLVADLHDLPTEDLLTQRMQVHEKTGWMLRSLLE